MQHVKINHKIEEKDKVFFGMVKSAYLHPPPLNYFTTGDATKRQRELIVTTTS